MKIGTIGCGFVGSSGVFAMALVGAATELILVDLNSELAFAHAEDILHAVPFGKPARITAGDYAKLKGAGLVVLACGVGQKPGESRLQLLIETTIQPILSSDEEQALHRSAAVLREAAAELNL